MATTQIHCLLLLTFCFLFFQPAEGEPGHLRELRDTQTGSIPGQAVRLQGPQYPEGPQAPQVYKLHIGQSSTRRGASGSGPFLP